MIPPAEIDRRGQAAGGDLTDERRARQIAILRCRVSLHHVRPAISHRSARDRRLKPGRARQRSWLDGEATKTPVLKGIALILASPLSPYDTIELGEGSAGDLFRVGLGHAWLTGRKASSFTQLARKYYRQVFSIAVEGLIHAEGGADALSTCASILALRNPAQLLVGDCVNAARLSQLLPGPAKGLDGSAGEIAPTIGNFRVCLSPRYKAITP